MAARSASSAEALEELPVLAVEAFASLLEARVVIEDWRIEYNTVRPHSSLGWRPPSLYAVASASGAPRPIEYQLLSQGLDQQPGAGYLR